MKCLALSFLPILAEAAYLDIFRRAGAFQAGSQAGGDAAHQSAAAAWGSYSFSFPSGGAASAWSSFSWPHSAAPAVPAASPDASPAASPAASVAPAVPAAPAPATSQAAASPAAAPAAPSIPTGAPAAVSSAVSSFLSANGVPSVATPAPATVSSIIASAGSVMISGAPVTALVPTGVDSIPAAQCTGGTTTGGQWEPFLVAHQETNPSLQCPTDDSANIHWFLDAQSMGCCPQSAYLTSAVAGQWACCPCGSSCAGLPPAPLQNWSLSSGTLLIGKTPYTEPAAQPSGQAASAGLLSDGVYTTAIGGYPVVLPFQPNGQQHVFCFAEGCETILYGANTAVTIIDPDAGGLHLSTTATRVLFATSGEQVIPTSTAYGVYEAGAGPRPTAAGMVMAGMVAGVAMIL